MRINKHDTQGTKPLLGRGELGYDDYTAGGDVGRVYVGTGSENIALAKKLEVDSHVSKVDNPHGVTKVQVGLGNVDNTADVNKNVLSATKLTTARTIRLSGDVAGSVSFDGSADVTITTIVQPNSVELGTDTTGNYMLNVTAGSGISVSHTQGEGSTATITNSAPNVTTNITTTHTSTNVVVNSSDGTDGTINSATQTLAGVMSAVDKTKLDGIAAGAQVNVATNLGITAGTTAGPIVTSSTGTNATLPTASASASGVVTTGDQTWSGVKTFSSSPIVPTPTTGTHAVNKDYADLKVALASFIGTNQNLATSGYQKLPGGLIVQWNSGTTSSNPGTLTLPIAFPNGKLGAVANFQNTSSSPVYLVMTTEDLGSATTTISIKSNAPQATIGVTYFAIGY